MNGMNKVSGAAICRWPWQSATPGGNGEAAGTQIKHLTVVGTHDGEQFRETESTFQIRVTQGMTPCLPQGEKLVWER